MGDGKRLLHGLALLPEPRLGRFGGKPCRKRRELRFRLFEAIFKRTQRVVVVFERLFRLCLSLLALIEGGACLG